MTSGCRGTPHFGRYDRPGAAFETGDFVEEKLGGLPWNDSLGGGQDMNFLTQKTDLGEKKKGKTATM